ncbi:MAG: RNA 2',3'-cyclic phosphodiesterase [Betaproteobacteria bacterium]|nr:MAG: RNA 2',3'-cyclic phosphodiesterase [Betaproteobacteria bacterium]
MSSTTSTSPVATARLFIGLWPDDEVRAALLAHREDWRWPPSAVWMAPQRLHMTMHFLGMVPRDRVPLLRQALKLAVVPFDLSLDHGEVWHGGVAVLRPSEVPAALNALHDRLARALELIEQPTVRPELKPHLTLARHAQGALPPKRSAKIHWRVARYALVESIQQPPSRYEVLQEYG